MWRAGGHHTVAGIMLSQCGGQHIMHKSVAGIILHKTNLDSHHFPHPNSTKKN
jgi:hypothetical protein